MSNIEKQKRCFYLDSEFQPASDMLRECVGDINTPYRFGCDNNPMRQEMPEDVTSVFFINRSGDVTSMRKKDYGGDKPHEDPTKLLMKMMSQKPKEK